MSADLDGSVCTVLGKQPPDWVCLPDALGGTRQRVLGAGEAPCVCGTEHAVWHLALGDGLYVAECGDRGFLWYNRNERADAPN